MRAQRFAGLEGQSRRLCRKKDRIKVLTEVDKVE